MPLRGLSGRLRVQPGADGFSGLADRRGPANLGSLRKPADAREQQLQDRRFVRLVVGKDQIERRHVALHRTRGDRFRQKTPGYSDAAVSSQEIGNGA